MEAQLFGFESFDGPGEDGELVSGMLGQRRIVGLKGHDQQGEYVIVLKGSEEAAPAVIALANFEEPLGVIKGSVSIEPIDSESGFASPRADVSTPGCLLIGPDGQLGISVSYRLSIARTAVYSYYLATGLPWDSTHKALAFADWRILVHQPGRTAPFELARFSAAKR